MFSSVLLRRLTLNGSRRWMCSSSSKSKSRQVAERLAKKRRLQEEALLGGDAQGTGSPILAIASGIGFVGLCGYFTFSETGNQFFMKNIYNGTPFGQGVNFAKSIVADTVKPFTDPISEELLPDFDMSQMPPHVTEPPPTLILDFEDTLVKLEWDPKYGWRAIKRPGVDEFLYHLASRYEIVLFTSGNLVLLEPFINSLDRMGAFRHRLYREATKYVDGKHIKDLSHLNRDLNRVIVVDDDPEAVAYHPENTIVIKKFENPREPDRELLDLLPFLEDVLMRDVHDFRTEITRLKTQYNGAPFTKAFREDYVARHKKAEEDRKGTLGGALRGGLFGGGRTQQKARAQPQQAAPQPQQQQQQQVPPPQQPILQDLPMTPVEVAASLPALSEQQKAATKKKETTTIWNTLLKS